VLKMADIKNKNKLVDENSYVSPPSTGTPEIMSESNKPLPEPPGSAVADVGQENHRKTVVNGPTDPGRGPDSGRDTGFYKVGGTVVGFVLVTIT